MTATGCAVCVWRVADADAWTTAALVGVGVVDRPRTNARRPISNTAATPATISGSVDRRPAWPSFIRVGAGGSVDIGEASTIVAKCSVGVGGAGVAVATG